MPTEVWFRNPDNYIRELVEVGEYKIAWDRGLLVKKRIDPIAHASLYFGKAFPYRILLVGEQGTAEFRPGDTMQKPTAVYPTWCYGEDSALLEELIEQPVGMDLKSCSDFSVPPDERPVLGQEHRVVITELPSSSTGPGRKFLRYLKMLQEDNPECIIHVHGLYGWKVAFGMGWRAADIEPRTAAHKGKVHLPSGKEEKFERVQAHPQWVTVLGFKPVDLEVPRNRCMYNIKSAVWAGEHYETLYKFKTRSDEPVDHESTPAAFRSPASVSHLSSNKKKSEGDHFLCNTCSLQNDCKYYREGAVCSVPGAEPVKLSRMFASRDADQIIDGLGTLMAANTTRLERGLKYEEVDGELDPEVSKMMGQVFDQAVKLAKMVDPGRFAGPKVQVNVGNGGSAAVGASGNPRQLIASAVRELEARGIAREDITTEMIQGLLTGMSNPDNARQAIEGTVMSSHEQRE